MTSEEAAYLLGLPLDASQEQIEDARKREARLWHPDRQTDRDVARFASDRMARINQAADLLLADSDRLTAERIASTFYERAAPPRADLSNRPKPRTADRDALVRAGRVGVVTFALTVAATAPFLNLTATYALALMFGAGASLIPIGQYIAALKRTGRQSDG